MVITAKNVYFYKLNTIEAKNRKKFKFELQKSISKFGYPGWSKQRHGLTKRLMTKQIFYWIKLAESFIFMYKCTPHLTKCDRPRTPYLKPQNNFRPSVFAYFQMGQNPLQKRRWTIPPEKIKLFWKCYVKYVYPMRLSSITILMILIWAPYA